MDQHQALFNSEDDSSTDPRILLDRLHRLQLELEEHRMLSARAARIEAALETVRSRALSMRRSDELPVIARLMFDQLKELGLELEDGLIIMVFREDSHDQLQWPVLEGLDMEGMYLVPEMDDPVLNAVYRAREKGIRFMENHYEREVKDEFLKKIFTRTDYRVVPPEYQALNFAGRCYHVSFAMEQYTGILVHSYNRDKYEEEHNEIIRRFARVFEQAYVRFLDLQKAEEDLLKIDKALSDLRQAQRQLIQAEKMASLGELTAGIAHEIQNPLNFVNNFSDINIELIEELGEMLDGSADNDVREVLGMLHQNQEKICSHGKRADAIVKGMLQHSRTGNGVKEATDLNALADEYLRLAFHGAKAQDKDLRSSFRLEKDEGLPKMDLVAQDIGRVLLNLFNNAFYTVNEKARISTEAYMPEVSVSLSHDDSKVRLTVRDNGMGIPADIHDKVFQPFFTTKPTGKGTGLGLSLSYDIVRAHDGSLSISSSGPEGTTMVLELPLVS